MTPRVTVSVLTYTAVRQSKACIASLLRQTVPLKLILTANGNPEAAAYFTDLAKEFANITVVINDRNLGFMDPNRHALTLCDTECFLLLNDDTTLPPDGLAKLIDPFDQFPKAALSGPKDDFCTLLPNFHGMKGGAFEYLNGACLMCKTEIVKKHGLFDPHLTFAYAEDSDLSLRMREQGYTLHRVDFVLDHEKHATARHVQEVNQHQAHNHAYCLRRWNHYLRVRRMDYPIVIRRAGAFGDVLLTTPVIRALREKYPLSPIHVETGCPQIFLNNPDVTSATQRTPNLPDALLFELNGSYESFPNQHFVWSYAQRCGFEQPVDDRTHLFVSDQDRVNAVYSMPGDDWAAVQVGPNTWRSKEWPADRFQQVIENLRAMGMKVVLVGMHGRGNSADADMRGRTTIQEMGALIERAKIFIGLDSLPMHVSQAMHTPTIGLFGVTDPQWIMTSGSRHIGVCGTTETFGLRHRRPGTTHVDDGGAAMDSISVEAVMVAVEQILKPNTVPA
jgi:ADP-heptose:LPS heptosyltransferase/GT2 family glycosyltransferase